MCDETSNLAIQFDSNVRATEFLHSTVLLAVCGSAEAELPEDSKGFTFHWSVEDERSRNCKKTSSRMPLKKTSAKPGRIRNTFTCHSASGVGVIKRPVGNLFSQRLTSSADRVACLRRCCSDAEQQQQQQLVA
ncbi:hypothetical protein T07_6208 [Trichinella nelsoni]|uniref:Uncharacterized protein n=1 Tax=Trichinella nelsoni TaxID=6336 RepID=A0A0V0S710_9BILA|nr:hypothetical protein T07_6208 [Trichinella nelsoni]